MKTIDAGRETWLLAAQTTLSRDGVNAISIAGLARELGVSRGAFYWHFESRDALLADLLPAIANQAIPPVLMQLQAMDFDSGSLVLLDAAYLPDRAMLNALHHARILGRWSRNDPAAKMSARSLQKSRLLKLRSFLRQKGRFTQSDARIRADILDRGLFEPAKTPRVYDRAAYATDLAHLFRFHFGRTLPANLLSRHINRTLPEAASAVTSAKARRCAQQSERQPR